MAVVRVKRSTKRDVWRVRWRDESRRMYSKTFDRKADAEAFEAKVKLAKRRGDLADLDAGKETLERFIAEWWKLYAEPRLSPKTCRLYASLRDRFIVPNLGRIPLRRLSPAMVAQLQANMLATGVGQETTRKTLALLQGILERAVEWGRITANPARVIKKPPQGRRRLIRPLAPERVESIRAHLLKSRRQRDATLVSVLAYAGLRPGEALALTWGDVAENVLLVDKALALGAVKDTKTGQARTVSILRPLATDLAEWKLASGRPGDKSLVFPTRHGQPWSESDYRNWRRRIFGEAAKAVRLDSTRPYDLRHSFSSLLLAEGRNPIEVAAQMGHSPVMTLQTYGHVIEELRGKERQSAEQLIVAARNSCALNVPRRTRTRKERASDLAL